MERRAAGTDGSSNPPPASSSSYASDPGRCTVPVPWRRRIRGGPLKAHSITTMRPFSRRWAIVSAPLPTPSRYASVDSSRTRSVPIGPLGDTFTWPSQSSGAVPTKNNCCAAIHARWCASMPSKTFAMSGRPAPALALGEVDDERDALEPVALAQAVLHEVGVVAREALAVVDLDGEAWRPHRDLGHVEQLQAMALLLRRLALRDEVAEEAVELRRRDAVRRA